MKTTFRYKNIAGVLFHNIINIKWKNTIRNRQCISCGCKISKNEKYLNLESRYDNRILTVSFCNDCGVFYISLKDMSKYINSNLILNSFEKTEERGQKIK